MSHPTIPTEVIQAYFGDAEVNIRQLSGGKINVTYRVKCGDTEIILQRINRIFNPKNVDDYAVIAEHLKGTEVAIPGVVTTKDGARVVTDHQGNHWRGFEAFENGEVGNQPHEYGRLLAVTLRELHALTNFRPAHADPHHHDTDYYVQQLRKGIEAIPSEEGCQLGQRMLQLYDELQTMPTAPAQLIHGDPKVNNLLFRNGRPYTFVDWDTPMIGTIWMDLGDMLRSVAKASLNKRGYVNRHELNEVIAGFYEVDERVESEIEFRQQAMVAAQVITLELAVRYLIDHEAHGRFEWDDKTYGSRHEHNLARARELLAILEELSRAPTIYIDYDRTLFDTDRFIEDLRSGLASAQGLDEAFIREQWQQARMDGKAGGINFEQLADSVGLDVERIWSKTDQLLEANNYLLPGAADFVHGLIAAGYRPRILSFGHKPLQNRKIIANLDHLSTEDYRVEFDVIDDQHKNEFIRKHNPGQEGALVDDVAEQNLPLGFLEIHINHQGKSAAPIEEGTVFATTDFDQVSDVIKQQLPVVI